MHINPSAILAAFATVLTLFPAVAFPVVRADDLEQPLRVRFELVDGAEVAGRITGWDEEGFTGSFGRRSWTDVRPEDVWRLYRTLMDRNSAEQWINLGRVLLLAESDNADDARENAEKAFRMAIRLDDDAADAVDAVREQVRQIRAQREQRRREIEQEKLDTDNPEGRDYPAEPWPALTDQQQQLNTEVMKGHGRSAMERAGVDATLIETGRFLFYSEMDSADALRWARLLDRCYETLAGVLDLDRAGNIFWGKAVVLAFDDYDRFRLTEAELFKHLSPRSTFGLMHPRDEQVFINTWRNPDEVAFGELLCRLTTYAVLHRHVAPKRLPAWANDGLGYYVSARTFEQSLVEQMKRPFGLRFVREHPEDVPKLLSLDYGDEHWPGPDDIGPSVGYLFVELLLREDARAFAQWVRAVKTGDDWPDALAESYGVSLSNIVQHFVRWYRVND